MARTRATSKAAGTSFETESARYFTGELGLLVERMPKSGSNDKGDLRGVRFHSSPVAVECKNPGKESPLRIAQWWRETEQEIKNYSNSIAGILLIKQYGKALDESFVIFDDKNWDVLHGHELNLEVIETKSLPFETWGDYVGHGKVLKTARRKTGGNQNWYIITLKDSTALFDSMDSIPQVFLSDVDIVLLAETGRAVVTTTTGNEITINANKKELEKMFSPIESKPVAKKDSNKSKPTQTTKKHKEKRSCRRNTPNKTRRVITSSEGIDTNYRNSSI